MINECIFLVSLTLGVSAFPFCAVLIPRGNRIAVLTRIEGLLPTSVVVSRIRQAFDQYGDTLENERRQLYVTFYLKMTLLFIHFGLLLFLYSLIFLFRCIREQRERERLLRLEQEQEFMASLQADQEKVLK